MLGKNYSRKSKNLSLIAGLILFGLYYNSLLISKSILEQEKISSIIGIWWTHLLMILLIFIIYFYKNKMFRFSFN
jgi:lipopolysaccharide export system permease protein